MKTKIMLVVGLVVLFAAVSGYGQGIIKAKIDFSFKVEGKVLPPGEYEFTRDAQATTFRVQGQGKEGALAPILTRMAAEIHTTAQDSHLTFDVVGDTYLLSEIWIPGEDGYLIQMTKGPHTHKVINIKY
ncbi:MAG TPA: hypothetical protein VKT17_07645 [Acidobacteriota bacterium]|nr:hypothetical protein [Acidobacteriota bacterium]